LWWEIQLNKPKSASMEKIDRLVYKLYGLTPEEIKVVEIA